MMKDVHDAVLGDQRESTSTVFSVYQLNLALQLA